MALDRGRLGLLASRQMGTLEEDYGEDFDGEIYSVISIVEIVDPAEGGRQRDVRVRFDTDGDVLRLVAVLRQAEMQILRRLDEPGA